MTDRKTLPHRREHFVFDFTFGDTTYTAGYGTFPNGALAEIFLQHSKPNSERDIGAKDSAIVASIALQHGVALNDLRHALQRTQRGDAASALCHALDIIGGGE